jgi:Fe-S-cluster-containing hydrogenase component 2
VTYIIAEPCVDTLDQACVSVCPVDCIHFEQGVDRTLYRPRRVHRLWRLRAGVPVAAIFPEDSVPADQVKYTEVNAIWFQDREAARAKINEWNPV